MRLQPVWSKPIEAKRACFADLAGTGRPSPAVLAGRDILSLDAAGAEVSRVHIEAPVVAWFKAADIDGDGRPEILASHVHALRAYNVNGEALWEYPAPTGLLSVAPVASGVIVGLNGLGGLRLLDSRGHAAWEVTDLGNVWSVAADPWNQQRVLCTSAHGRIDVFDLRGRRVAVWRDGEAYHHALLPVRWTDGDGAILVTDRRESRAVGFGDDGHVAWQGHFEFECPDLESRRVYAEHLGVIGRVRVVEAHDGWKMPPAESRVKALLTKPQFVGAGDIDGDGVRELLVYIRAGLLGAFARDGHCAAVHDFGGSPPLWIDAADCDGDGRAEVLTSGAEVTLWKWA